MALRMNIHINSTTRVYLQRLTIFIRPETSVGISLFIVKQIKFPRI